MSDEDVGDAVVRDNEQENVSDAGDDEQAEDAAGEGEEEEDEDGEDIQVTDSSEV